MNVILDYKNLHNYKYIPFPTHSIAPNTIDIDLMDRIHDQLYHQNNSIFK